MTSPLLHSFSSFSPSRFQTQLLALGAALAVLSASLPAHSAEAETITLTQTGCQFIEPEGADRHYTTGKKADCDAINAETGETRLEEATVMRLAPGDYVFRVTNRDVPYDLGFWLRSHDYDWKNPLHKITRTSVSGGGLSPGKTRDYEVGLEPGEYLFSCPLNTTPDYKLVVEGPEGMSQ
ncbi:MAG: hypothetical protein ISR48_08490 [Alphaproteobacteria bacterium]|nr:hypothetical protein [Alphaproteobacteria bacterium]